MGSAADNPMGVQWFTMLMGLGFVLSFGYWCTDFLVMQRAMAAESMTAARRTPLVAAVPKMFFPFLVILPGMIAIALTQRHGASGFTLPAKPDGSPNYDLVIPMMLGHYFPSGILGLGLTALMASFMSGMAGNVTAFNTVWTYDIYDAYLRPDASDSALLWMGRAATVVGIAVSVAAAYFAAHFNNIMDLLQLVFAFVNAPLFATFLARHVLAAGDRTWCVLRPGQRHPRRRAPSWPDPATRRRHPGQGRLARSRAAYLSKRNGTEFLDRDLRLDDLLRGDDRRFVRHATSRNPRNNFVAWSLPSLRALPRKTSPGTSVLPPLAALSFSSL